jgi:hypothetical protein
MIEDGAFPQVIRYRETWSAVLVLNKVRWTQLLDARVLHGVY